MLRRARVTPLEAQSIHLESLPALCAFSSMGGALGLRVCEALSWAPGSASALSSLCSSADARIANMAASAIAALASSAQGAAEPLLLGGCAESAARLLRDSPDAGAVGAAARALSVFALARGGSSVGRRAAAAGTVRRLVFVLAKSAGVVLDSGGDSRWRIARADVAIALTNLTFANSEAAIAAENAGAVAVLSALLEIRRDADLGATRSAAASALANIVARSTVRPEISALKIVAVAREILHSESARDTERYAALGALANGLESVGGGAPGEGSWSAASDSTAAYWGLFREGSACIAGAAILATLAIRFNNAERCAVSNSEVAAAEEWGGAGSLCFAARGKSLCEAAAAASALCAIALAPSSHAALASAGAASGLVAAGARGAAAIETRPSVGGTIAALGGPGILNAPCDTLIGLRVLFSALVGAALLAETNGNQRGVLLDAGAAGLAVRAVNISLLFDSCIASSVPSKTVPDEATTKISDTDGDNDRSNFCARGPGLSSPFVDVCRKAENRGAGNRVTELAAAVGAAGGRLLAVLAFSAESARALQIAHATEAVSSLLAHSHAVPRNAAALGLASMFALLLSAPYPSPCVRVLLTAHTPVLTTALAFSAIMRSKERRGQFLAVGSAVHALVLLIGMHADMRARSFALIALRRLLCGGGGRAGAVLASAGATRALAETLVHLSREKGGGGSDADEALVALGGMIVTGGITRTRAALEAGPAVVKTLRVTATPATRTFAAELLATMSEGVREFSRGEEGVCDAPTFLIRAGAVSAAASALLMERESQGSTAPGEGSVSGGGGGYGSAGERPIGEGAPRTSIWARRSVRALRRILANVGATAAVRWRTDAQAVEEGLPAVSAAARDALLSGEGGVGATSRFAAAATAGVALLASTEFASSGALAALISQVARDGAGLSSHVPAPSASICLDCGKKCKEACKFDAIAWRLRAVGNSFVSGGIAAAEKAAKGKALVAVARIISAYSTRSEVRSAAFLVLENAIAVGGARAAAALERAPRIFVRRAIACASGSGEESIAAARFLQAWTSKTAGRRSVRSAGGGREIAHSLSKHPPPNVASALGAALCNISSDLPGGEDARAMARITIRQPLADLRGALGAPHADAVARAIASALALARGARARDVASDSGVLVALAARSKGGSETPLSAAAVRALSALSIVAPGDVEFLRKPAIALARAAEAALAHWERDGGREAASVAAAALRALATRGALAVAASNSPSFRSAIASGLNGIGGPTVARTAARAAAAVARSGGAEATATLVFGGGAAVAQSLTLLLARAMRAHGRISAPSAAALAAAFTGCKSCPPCDPRIHEIVLLHAVSRRAHGVSRSLACAPLAALSSVAPCSIARAFADVSQLVALRVVKIAAKGGSVASRAMMRASIARALRVRAHHTGLFVWPLVRSELIADDITSFLSRGFDGRGDESGSMAALSSALAERKIGEVDGDVAHSAWAAGAIATTNSALRWEENRVSMSSLQQSLSAQITFDAVACTFIQTHDAASAATLLFRLATDVPQHERSRLQTQHNSFDLPVTIIDAIVNAANCAIAEYGGAAQRRTDTIAPTPPYSSISIFSLACALIETLADDITLLNTAEGAFKESASVLHNASNAVVGAGAARAAASAARALSRLGSHASSACSAVEALASLATLRTRLLKLSPEGEAALAGARASLLCALFGAVWGGGGRVDFPLASEVRPPSCDDAWLAHIFDCTSALRRAADNAARVGASVREWSAFTDAASAARAAACCLVSSFSESIAARGGATRLCAALSAAARTAVCAEAGVVAGVAIAAGLRALLISNGGGGGYLSRFEFDGDDDGSWLKGALFLLQAKSNIVRAASIAALADAIEMKRWAVPTAHSRGLRRALVSLARRLGPASCDDTPHEHFLATARAGLARCLTALFSLCAGSGGRSETGVEGTHFGPLRWVFSSRSLARALPPCAFGGRALLSAARRVTSTAPRDGVTAIKSSVAAAFAASALRAVRAESVRGAAASSAALATFAHGPSGASALGQLDTVVFALANAAESARTMKNGGDEVASDWAARAAALVIWFTDASKVTLIANTVQLPSTHSCTIGADFFTAALVHGCFKRKGMAGSDVQSLPPRLIARVEAALSRTPTPHTLPLLIALAKEQAGRETLKISSGFAPLWLRCGTNCLFAARVSSLISLFACQSAQDVAIAASALHGVRGAARNALFIVAARVSATNSTDKWARILARELLPVLTERVDDGVSLDGGVSLASAFAILPLLRPSSPDTVRAISKTLEARATPAILICAAIGAAANQAAVAEDGLALLSAFGVLRAARQAANNARLDRRNIAECTRLRDDDSFDFPSHCTASESALALNALAVNVSATTLVSTNEIKSLSLECASHTIAAALTLNAVFEGVGADCANTPIPPEDAPSLDLALFAWTAAAHGRILNVPAARAATRRALLSADSTTREGIALALSGARNDRRPLSVRSSTVVNGSSDDSEGTSTDESDDVDCEALRERAHERANRRGGAARTRPASDFSVLRFARSISLLISSPRSPPAAAAAALTAALRVRAPLTYAALESALTSPCTRVSRRAARVAARAPSPRAVRPLTLLLATGNARAGAAAAARALAIIARSALSPASNHKYAAINAGAPRAALTALTVGSNSVARAAACALGALALPAACKGWPIGVAASAARALAASVRSPPRARIATAAAHAIAQICNEGFSSPRSRARALESAAAFVGAGGAQALLDASIAATATWSRSGSSARNGRVGALSSAAAAPFAFAAAAVARAGARADASAISAAFLDAGLIDVATSALAARVSAQQGDDATTAATTLLASVGARAAAAPTVLSRALDSPFRSAVCAGALALARDALLHDIPGEDATADSVLNAALVSGVRVLMWSAASALAHSLSGGKLAEISEGSRTVSLASAHAAFAATSEGSSDEDETRAERPHALAPRPHALSSIPSALLTCSLDKECNDSSMWATAAISRAAAEAASHSAGTRRALNKGGGAGAISRAAIALAPYSSTPTLRALSAALASLASAPDTRALWVTEASQSAAEPNSRAGRERDARHHPLRAVLALASAQRACGITRSNAVRAAAAAATPTVDCSQEDVGLALRSVAICREYCSLIARAAPTQPLEASAAAMATAAAATAIGGAWVPLQSGGNGDRAALPPRILANALASVADAAREVMSSTGAPARAVILIGGQLSAVGGGATAAALLRGAPSRACATAFALAAATLDAAADALRISLHERAAWIHGAVWCAAPLAAAPSAVARARLAAAFAAASALGRSPSPPPAPARAALAAILAGATGEGGLTRKRLLRCAAFGIAGAATSSAGVAGSALARRVLLASLRSEDAEAVDTAAFACLAVALAAAAAPPPRDTCSELCDGSDDARALLCELAALSSCAPPRQAAAGALLVLARVPRNLPELAAAGVTDAIQLLARAATGVACKNHSVARESRADADARRALGEFGETASARFNAAQAVFALAALAASSDAR
jgi:hypothetical protein